MSYFLVFCTVVLVASWQPSLWAKTVKHHMTSGVEKRIYHVYVPKGYSANRQHPLVIVLHGGGGNHKHAEKISGMSQRADLQGFIVAYPDGSGRNDFILTWNATHCCGYAQHTGARDIAFIDGMIDQIAADYSIDSKRVYIAGMSNGAMMAYQVGILLSHRVAGVGAVVGAMFGDESRPAQPVSVVMFNGVEDEHVPIEGGYSKVAAVEKQMDQPYQSADYAFHFWADANACLGEPDTDRMRSVERIRARECANGTDVIQYRLHGAKHAWPGGQKGSPWADEPTQDISATDVMLDFFLQHPKTPVRRQVTAFERK